MSSKPDDVVSASEIASWTWCPESWRLDALGNESGNLAELARGDAFHARTSVIEIWTRRAMVLGLWLFVLAAVGAAVWYALFGAAR